jgi:hypothetical protein
LAAMKRIPYRIAFDVKHRKAFNDPPIDRYEAQCPPSPLVD